MFVHLLKYCPTDFYVDCENAELLLFHAGRYFTDVNEVNYNHWSSECGFGLYCALNPYYCQNHRCRQHEYDFTVFALDMKKLWYDVNHAQACVYLYNYMYGSGPFALHFNSGNTPFTHFAGGQVVVKLPGYLRIVQLAEIKNYLHFVN